MTVERPDLPDLPAPEKADRRPFRNRLATMALTEEHVRNYPVADPNAEDRRRTLERIGAELSGHLIVDPARQWYAFGEFHPVSDHVVYNPGPQTASYEMSWSDTTSVAHSVEVASGAGVAIKEIFEVAVTATYGQAWTDEHTKGEAVAVGIRPGHFGWIDRATLISTVEGEFFLSERRLTTLGGADFCRDFFPEVEPFRWTGVASGPGRVGTMTGVLMTAQRPADEETLRLLEGVEGVRRHGDLRLFPRDAFLGVPSAAEVLRTPVGGGASGGNGSGGNASGDPAAASAAPAYRRPAAEALTPAHGTARPGVRVSSRTESFEVVTFAGGEQPEILGAASDWMRRHPQVRTVAGNWRWDPLNERTGTALWLLDLVVEHRRERPRTGSSPVPR
ncbi:hypothetical protein [Allostreptomyces psammosilenae]|uniref:Uncharacterized protein n=1 Tax=Allostreptomyces psammosilenae TaxID=1892865 RepID=A0A853AD10_9ACTN|nr:hypothetical protein [Allostreptomyces psammosilenae]NYI08222.1 hypothetical protein [Allostreptomyces psammosilenae]